MRFALSQTHVSLMRHNYASDANEDDWLSNCKNKANINKLMNMFSCDRVHLQNSNTQPQSIITLSYKYREG